MRPIRFRGKKTTDRTWTQGNLTLKAGRTEQLAYINSSFGGDLIKVAPDTVGQFSGLYDQKGTPIFEGDLLKMPTEHYIRGLLLRGVFSCYYAI